MSILAGTRADLPQATDELNAGPTTMKLYMTEMSGNSFKVRVLASMLGLAY